MDLCISIHALREEGDPTLSATSSHTTNFYPRPPRGGRLAATARETIHGDFYPRPPRGGRHTLIERNKDVLIISIHALREEGDEMGRKVRHDPHYFYPRPPRGGRLTTCRACP